MGRKKPNPMKIFAKVFFGTILFFLGLIFIGQLLQSQISILDNILPYLLLFVGVIVGGFLLASGFSDVV